MCSARNALIGLAKESIKNPAGVWRVLRVEDPPSTTSHLNDGMNYAIPCLNAEAFLACHCQWCYCVPLTMRAINNGNASPSVQGVMLFMLYIFNDFFF